MTILATTLLIARLQTLRVVRSKRFKLCLALALLPAAIALAITSFPTHISAENLAAHLGWLLTLQVLLPVISLIAGSAVIAEEVEDRTLTYLFSRPIDRSGVFLGRWIVFASMTLAVLLIGAAALLWAASRGALLGATEPATEWTRDIAVPLLQALVLGSIVYSALFATIGVLTRRPVIFGLAYSFAIEGFFANLPGKTQALTIQYHLRAWIAGSHAAIWSQIEGFDATSFESRAQMLVTSVVLILLALSLGVWLVRRREFVVSA